MNWKKTIVCLFLTLFLAETAMAWPRIFRRRRAYNLSSYGQVYDDRYGDIPTSSAIYDWDEIAKIDAAVPQPFGGHLHDRG